MSAVCPVCLAAQVHSLLCSACCDRLERDLGDVAAIVAELDVTLSRQDRIGEAGKSGSGWAREKSPAGDKAMDPRWVLSNVLTTWARDVTADQWRPAAEADQTAAAARLLLAEVPAIRRHPAVAELVDEISDAIGLARRTVDRPADRAYFGACYAETLDEDGKPVTCLEEIWARPWASEVTCRVCGTEHEIAERRAWLLERAQDMIVTVREASSYLGEVGNIRVTEASIRGYLHRGRIGYRTGTMIRLGDLLDVVLEESERRTA